MKELSEGEKLYWEDQAAAKERIRKEYGLFGIFKCKFYLMLNQYAFGSWEDAEDWIREKKIRKMYKV